MPLTEQQKQQLFARLDQRKSELFTEQQSSDDVFNKFDQLKQQRANISLGEEKQIEKSDELRRPFGDTIKDTLHSTIGNTISSFLGLGPIDKAKKMLTGKGIGEFIIDEGDQFGLGMAKGAISTATGSSGLGEKMLHGTLKTILPESLEKKFGVDKKIEKSAAEQLIPESFRTPKTKAEKIGFITEQLAEYFLPGSASTKLGKSASFISALESSPKWFKSAIDLATKSLAEGAIFAGQSSLQKGSTSDSMKEAAFGAAMPVVGKGLSVTKEATIKQLPKISSKIVNSLIKPLLKDFSYGKNPGLGVAQEGIVANSFDDLVQKISIKRKEIGTKIGEVITSAGDNIKIAINNILDPIEEAIQKAKKMPETNNALISRLQSLKNDLQKRIGSRKNINLSDAFNLKVDIGDITKWTGNKSDDEIINATLKNIWGRLSEKLNKALPELKKLNERYANLTSAEIAAKYRDKILERQNLISLSNKFFGATGAIGTLIATSGSAFPALAAGAIGTALDKALGSTAIKTRVAKWLATASKQEKELLFKQMPVIRDTIERVFGSNALK